MMPCSQASIHSRTFRTAQGSAQWHHLGQLEAVGVGHQQVVGLELAVNAALESSNTSHLDRHALQTVIAVSCAADCNGSVPFGRQHMSESGTAVEIAVQAAKTSICLRGVYL